MPQEYQDYWISMGALFLAMLILYWWSTRNNGNNGGSLKTR